MSFLTCRCDLPQKLQRSCSFESVGRATDLLLGPRVPAGLGPHGPRPAWVNTRQERPSLQGATPFRTFTRLSRSSETGPVTSVGTGPEDETHLSFVPPASPDAGGPRVRQGPSRRPAPRRRRRLVRAPPARGRV